MLITLWRYSVLAVKHIEAWVYEKHFINANRFAAALADASISLSPHTSPACPCQLCSLRMQSSFFHPYFSWSFQLWNHFVTPLSIEETVHYFSHPTAADDDERAIASQSGASYFLFLLLHLDIVYIFLSVAILILVAIHFRPQFLIFNVNWEKHSAERWRIMEWESTAWEGKLWFVLIDVNHVCTGSETLFWWVVSIPEVSSVRCKVNLHLH